MPFLFALFAVVFWAQSSATPIRIIVPYAGPLVSYNHVEHKSSRGTSTIEMRDTALMGGVFFQWVEPESYEWNTFLYHSRDINFSNVTGGHFIYDRYLLPGPYGKLVLGAGCEYVRIDMRADSQLQGTDPSTGALATLYHFQMSNNVLPAYLRAGYQFERKLPLMRFSALPWAGVQYQPVWGDIEIRPFQILPEQHVIIDSKKWYGMAGLNLKTVVFHFIELEGKYYGTFNLDRWFPTASGMVNLYASRRFGLSYRAKYMVTSEGNETYHIFGAAFVF